MRNLLLAAGVVAALGPSTVTVAVSPLISISTGSSDTGSAAALVPVLQRAQARVESFFGQPFTARIDVDLAPDRAGFDARLKARWQMPPTECWMVAAADASGMPVLDPRQWKAQACEHDGSDTAHVASVLTHELVHAYHGQHNPRRDMSLPDDMGWFAEGLAVYASGQLDDGHLADPREAITQGKAPARLADAWSGKYRYGVSGTIVRTADQRAGRAALVKALAATTSSEALEALGMTEVDLLAAWRTSISSR